MTSLALERTDVIVGVDTHKDEHVAFAIGGLGGGRLAEPLRIPATNAGYAGAFATMLFHEFDSPAGIGADRPRPFRCSAAMRCAEVSRRARLMMSSSSLRGAARIASASDISSPDTNTVPSPSLATTSPAKHRFEQTMGSP